MYVHVSTVYHALFKLITGSVTCGEVVRKGISISNMLNTTNIHPHSYSNYKGQGACMFMYTSNILYVFVK